METSATLRNARFSAQKGRLVADAIRGKRVEQALDWLAYSAKDASVVIRKVVESAIANAEHNEGADIDELTIASICVDEAATAKRFQARARGRGNRILKRSCHIRVVVSDGQE